jgi:hypothetical protein
MTYVQGTGNSGSTVSSTWTFNYTPMHVNDAVTIAAYCNDASTPASIATLTSPGWTIAQLIPPVPNGIGAGALWAAFAPSTSTSTFTAGFGSTTCSNFYGYITGEFQGNTTSSLAVAFPVQGSSGGTSSFACNQPTAGISPSTGNNAIWNACFGAPSAAAIPWTQGAADGGGGDLAEYQLLFGNPGSQVPNYGGTSGIYVVLGTSIASTSSIPAAPSGLGVILLSESK